MTRAPSHRRDPHRHGAAYVAERTAAILEALRADGGRVTTGRRAIVRALLAGRDHHVTAEDIADVVRAHHPDVHLSTVYRTLDALEQLGVVNRVNLGQAGAVYHLADHAHHHLVCESCGSVTEISNELVVPLARAAAKRFGFVVAPHHLAISGRCASCADAGGAMPKG